MKFVILCNLDECPQWVSSLPVSYTLGGCLRVH